MNANSGSVSAFSVNPAMGTLTQVSGVPSAEGQSHYQSQGLKDRLVDLAKREHRSLNQQIEFLLEKALSGGGQGIALRPRLRTKLVSSSSPACSEQKERWGEFGSVSTVGLRELFALRFDEPSCPASRRPGVSAPALDPSVTSEAGPKHVQKRPTLRVNIPAKRPPFLAGGIYDCVRFASLDRRNMAPKHVRPAPRR